jgi:hypothetical protein
MFRAFISEMQIENPVSIFGLISEDDFLWSHIEYWSPMKHGLSWQTASLLHLIGSEGKRIVKIANTK